MIVRVTFEHLLYKIFRSMCLDKSPRGEAALLPLLLASNRYVNCLDAVLFLQAIMLENGQHLLTTYDNFRARYPVSSSILGNTQLLVLLKRKAARD